MNQKRILIVNQREDNHLKHILNSFRNYLLDYAENRGEIGWFLSQPTFQFFLNKLDFELEKFRVSSPLEAISQFQLAVVYIETAITEKRWEEETVTKQNGTLNGAVHRSEDFILGAEETVSRSPVPGKGLGVDGQPIKGARKQRKAKNNN